MATLTDLDSENSAEYEKMFLDKLTLLNRTFLRVIEGCVKDMPDADLSPTVRDYLKHVESLDEMYGGKSRRERIKKRPIKVAKRSQKCKRSNDQPVVESKPKEIPLQKPQEAPLPVTSAVPCVSPKATPTSISNPKFDFGNSSSLSSSIENDSGRRGRKRANRGGQDGGDDIVIITPQKRSEGGASASAKEAKYDASNDKSSEQGTVASSSDNSTKAETPRNASLTFGASKPSNSEGTTGPPNKMPFSFGSPAAKKDDLKDKNDGKPENLPKIPAVFSFGASSNTPPTNRFVIGKTENEEKNTSTTISTPVPLFNITKSSDSEEKATSGPPPKLTFPSSTSTFKTETSSKLVFAFDAGKSTSSDVSGVKPLAPGSLSGFKFGPSASAPTTSDSTKTDEKEDEYVPPKPEAVIQEEPNAIVSTKCSVFVLKGKEYEKVGIGQLHIKKDDDDDKKIMLIRAATTIATVWVNSYIDKNTKCAKADDTKLRVSCVNGTTPNTYLIRFPNAKTREQVEEQLKV